MNPNRNLCACAIALSFVFVAGAHAAKAPESVSILLPKGQVSCISLKDAQNYANYAKTAPKFAADMLDRATCFIPAEDMESVILGAEKGYDKLRLLSGHIVWVPQGSVKGR